jgi:hypothetical protein
MNRGESRGESRGEMSRSGMSTGEGRGERSSITHHPYVFKYVVKSVGLIELRVLVGQEN